MCMLTDYNYRLAIMNISQKYSLMQFRECLVVTLEKFVKYESDVLAFFMIAD